MSASEEAILILGPDQRVVLAHEATIRTRSAYLDHLFATTPPEHVRSDGQGRSILAIPDKPSDLLNTYIYWLQGHLVLPSDVRTKQARYKFYARLYVFGEEIRDPAFQDSTIDGIVYAYRHPDPGGREYPDDEVVNIIYAGTPVRSPARQLMVDLRLCDVERRLSASPATNLNLPLEFLAHLDFEYAVAHRTDPALRYVRQRLEVGEPVVYHHRIIPPRREAGAGLDRIDEVDEEGGPFS